MANKNWALNDRFGTTISVPFLDNGDGTYSPIVSSSGGGGGGGGAVTIADGADVTLGAKADSAYAGGGGSVSAIAILKGLYAALVAATPAGTNTVGNVGVNNQPVGPAGFAVSNAAITSSTGSTIALAARTGAVGTGRVSGVAYNNGPNTAYVGASGVTSSGGSIGVPILPGGAFNFNHTAALYAVCASGQTSTLIFEEEF
jgi:hypothetical protein